jgi:hypothetical protein
MRQPSSVSLSHWPTWQGASQLICTESGSFGRQCSWAWAMQEARLTDSAIEIIQLERGTSHSALKVAN